MNTNMWTDVDGYFESVFINDDPVLEAVLAYCEEAGLPPHNISPCHGRLLQLIAMVSRAERVLEIGTLGGYSAICMARGISDNGAVVTIENSPERAAVAAHNFKLAGVDHKVRVIEGDARSEIRRLIDAGAPPFDLFFIDADKPSNPMYLDLCLRLSRPGTIIIGDNAVRKGQITNPESDDENVKGMREYCEQLRVRDLLSTGIQTVGRMGWDGFTLSIVR